MSCQDRREVLKVMVVGLLVALVAGCGGTLERPQPMAARIVLTESGGLAGMVSVLTIEVGGSVTYQTSQGTKSTRLTAKQMERLVGLFYDKGFFAMKDDYRPQRPVADGITTSLVYGDARRSKTVITATNGTEPAGLQDILRDLKGVIAQTR